MRFLRLPAWRTAIAAAIAGSFAAACSIEEPKLPTLETELVLPLGTLRYDVAELIEGEDSFVTGEDDVIALQIGGDLDSVSVGEAIDIHVDGAGVDAVLDGVELSAGTPASFAFTLGALYPPAQSAAGMPLPVPPFTFTVVSPTQDLPGFTSASIRSGEIQVTLTNGLPVPLGGAAPPEQILLRLADPASGTTLTQLLLTDELPAGQTRTHTLDLAGASAGDSLRVELSGGSPGSQGAPVGIDPAACLSVDVTCDALVVDSAVAPIPAQSFRDTLVVDLPDSVQVVRGTIARGTLRVDLVSDLPLPLTARLLVPALHRPDGSSLQMDVPLAAGAAASASSDLTDCTLEFEGAVGDRLEVLAVADTPGSLGGDVAIQSGTSMHAELLPLTLSFASVTGIVDPQRVELDPTHVDVDLPDEMEQLQLEQAELRLELHTGVQMPAAVDLRLQGVSADGAMVPLDLHFDLASPEGEGIADHQLVFDGTNSELLPFLNNLPVRIELSGSASVGDGFTPGTIRAGDALWASWQIDAPLSVALAPQAIELDARALDLSDDVRDEIRERVLTASVAATVRSTLPVGARVWIGLDVDSSRVHTQPHLRLGPVDLPAATGSKGGERIAAVAASELRLAAEDLPWIADQPVLQAVTVELPGTAGAFVVLRSTDRVEVSGMLRARLRIAED